MYNQKLRLYRAQIHLILTYNKMESNPMSQSKYNKTQALQYLPITTSFYDNNRTDLKYN